MVIFYLIPSTGPEKGTFLGFKGERFFVTVTQTEGVDSHTLLCQSQLKFWACVNPHRTRQKHLAIRTLILIPPLLNFNNCKQAVKGRGGW